MAKTRTLIFLFVFYYKSVSSKEDSLDNCIEKTEFTQLKQEMTVFCLQLKELRQKNAIQEEEIVKLRAIADAKKLELFDVNDLRKLTQSEKEQKLHVTTNTLSQTALNQSKEIKQLKAIKQAPLEKVDNKHAERPYLNIEPVQKSDTSYKSDNFRSNEEEGYSLSNTRYKRLLLGDEGDGIAFSASLTAPETTNLGQGQTIVFDNVISNLGNAYDKNIGVFRVPITGWYVFSLTLMSSPQETQELEVTLNGSVLFHCFTNGNEYNTASRTVVVHADVGDDVTVRTAQWQHSDKVHGYGHTSFTGFLLYTDISG